MYEDFFGFKTNPFKLAPSPQFFFQSKIHRRAFVTLYHGILQEQGILVLLGQPGTGKTTLIQTLAGDLEKLGTYKFIHLTYAPSFKEIIRTVVFEITKREEFEGNSQAIRALKDFLIGQRGQMKFVLVFDEAQNLDVQALEELRMLSNLELPQEKLLPVILVGQPKLERNLTSPDLSQLKQRISAYARLSPIQEDEIPGYLEYRMKSSGYAGDVYSVFDNDAVRDISYYSGGIPRLINSICHEALTYGYAMGDRLIKSEYVIEAAENLELVSVKSGADNKANIITLKEVVGESDSSIGATTSGAEISSSALVLINIMEGRLSKVEEELAGVKNLLSQLQAQKKNEESVVNTTPSASSPKESPESAALQFTSSVEKADVVSDKKSPPETKSEIPSAEKPPLTLSEAAYGDEEPTPKASNIIKIAYALLIVIFAIAGFWLYKKSGVDISKLKPAAKTGNQSAGNLASPSPAISPSPTVNAQTAASAAPSPSEPSDLSAKTSPLPEAPSPAPVAGDASAQRNPSDEPTTAPTSAQTVGKSGELSKFYFRPYIPGINIRNGPGMEYPVVRFAKSNDKFQKIGESDGGVWIKIRTQDGEEGWIADKFLVEEGKGN